MRQADEGEVSRWVARCRAGDEGAWSALVERYKSLVYSVARRSGLGAEDADDVFLATFGALYRHLDRIEEAAALGKWLAVTAARESYRTARITGKHGQASFEDLSLDELLADEEAAADRTALEADEADQIRKSVIDMDPKCRDLLTALYLREEADYVRVSEELGMPIGSIGPTRGRCLEKLRASLEKRGFFDSGTYQPKARQALGKGIE